MRRLLPAIAALLGACGGTDAYLEDLAAAECALYETCEYLTYLGVETVEECEAVVAAEPCDVYDAAAGDACLEGLAGLDCDAYAAGSWPAACDAACTAP